MFLIKVNKIGGVDEGGDEFNDVGVSVVPSGDDDDDDCGTVECCCRACFVGWPR
jgi:hypothetical protein